MRRTNKVRFLLCALAISMLTACSGGAGTASPPPLAQPGSTVPQSLLRAANSFAPPRAIVVSDATANTVNVFTPDGKRIATIGGFSEPQGLAANGAGSIFVADSANSRIVEYKDDYKTKLAIFADAGEYPSWVGVDDADGIVGVTNVLSTAGGSGSVSIFAKGQPARPCVTVHNTAWARVYFGAFDGTGNFYVVGGTADGKPLVGVVRDGCSSTTIATLTHSTVLNSPGGVAAGAGGTIYISDQTASAIYGFTPSKNSLGPPVSTTRLTGGVGSFALTHDAGDVWTLNSSMAGVSEYAFPAGGSPLRTIGAKFELPIGIAVAPPDIPD
jgi:hypothetical protein